MTLTELDKYIVNAKGAGSEHYGQCPVCEVNNPKGHHLYYKVDSNGKILLHCKKSGCNFEDIIKALNLPNESTKEVMQKTTREHIYYNIDGNIFAKKIIVKQGESKTAYWERYENGQFKKGLNGAKAPLYNIENIINADKVYIAEGEKDVDTLVKLGFTASTTSPNGANKNNTKGNWRTSDNVIFKNKEVIIFFDNDDAGRSHAETTATNLMTTAKSVKILDLLEIYPALKHKGDITDLCEIYGNAEKLVQAITTLEAETEVITTNADTTETDISCFYEKGKFLHNRLGEYLIANFNICKINRKIHIYDNGIYKPDDSIIQREIIRLIPDLTNTKRNEVLSYIKYAPSVIERKITAPEYIPLKSNIYNIETDKFFEYSPEYVFLNKFNIDYNINADRDGKIIQVIDQIADHDKDILLLIFEAIGMCLYRENRYRGCFIFYGEVGSNGKSTLCEIIKQFNGKENCSRLDLKNFSERFKIAKIYGKTANIGDDISDTTLLETDTFKKCVTGEEITTELKGVDAFEIEPYAKLFFSANTLPSIADKTKALYSRLKIIPLNHDFKACGDIDTTLKYRQWTESELQTLLLYAIEGLKRVMARGEFTEPKAVKEALQQYKIDNNPVLQFLHNEYDNDRQNIIGETISNIHARYNEWCKESNFRPVAINKFSSCVCSELNLQSRPVRMPIKDIYTIYTENNGNQYYYRNNRKYPYSDGKTETARIFDEK